MVWTQGGWGGESGGDGVGVGGERGVGEQGGWGRGVEEREDGVGVGGGRGGGGAGGMGRGKVV